MTYFKHSLAAMVVSALFICAPFSRADEWNKKTTVTIDKAIQLPNAVLQPGTYVFELADSQSNRDIVQVYDKNRTHLITTILAIPNYRLQPTGKTVLTFWEMPAGQMPALRAWFYPGDLYGQEFAYPKNRATEMASYTKTSVPTSNATSAEDMKTMPVTSTNENGESSELDQNTYSAQAQPAPAPAPAPAPSAQPAPEVAQNTAPEPQNTPEPENNPAPAPQQQQLPHTASPIPLIGLLGLLSLSGFAALRRTEKVR